MRSARALRIRSDATGNLDILSMAFVVTFVTYVGLDHFATLAGGCTS
jgi:hypothetical protein